MSEENQSEEVVEETAQAVAAPKKPAARVAAGSIMDKISADGLNKDIPAFKVGDVLKVHVKIREGNKERVQVYKGTVIARDGGGHTETITVRRVAYGEGVERVFPLHSPNIEKIELEKSTKVRRAKLYYTRDLKGKQARLT